MASYTTIDGATVLVPGKPLTSAIAQALNENPTALAEGASGAPKIRTAALQPPTSGSTPIRRLKDFSITQGSSGSTSGVMDESSIGVLVGGTVRMVCTIATSGSPTTFETQFRKNGTAVATYTNLTGVRFSDISVALGDRLDFFVSVSTGSSATVTLTDIKIESGTADFAVA